MSTSGQTGSCEDMALLSSRALDLDLDKAEVLSFYLHIVRCQECRLRLEQVVSQEQECLLAVQQYETFSLTDDFNQKILAALAAEPTKTLAAAPKRPLARMTAWLHQWGDVLRQRPMLPAVSGLAATVGLALALGLWSWGPGLFKGTQERLLFHDIPFQFAKDEISWNHSQTVPPNCDLYVRVHRRDPQPYLFRLSSQEPVKVFLMHTGNGSQKAGQKELVISGIRYVTLDAPRPNDIVLIRNQGGQPLHVNTYSPLPESIDMGIEQYRK